MRTLSTRAGLALSICAAWLVPISTAAASSFVGSFNTISPIASTVPGNGDVNPYGVAVVPHTVGTLVQGNVLVSNFNNSANAQGTGSTIVQIAPNGTMSLFAQITPAMVAGRCPGGVGLTTALVILHPGWVIVGSLPTANGMSATAKAGCLIVLNPSGQVVETFAGGPINGPWDMTAVEAGSILDGDDVGGIPDADDVGKFGFHLALLFVTNVLNGTVAASPNVVRGGTVVRILLLIRDGQPPFEVSSAVIGSGFGERTDPNALVIGPTGVGLARDGTLYVADTLANRIAAIPNAVFRISSAQTGRTVSTNGALNGPLGLAMAPNGDILVVNSGDGNLVETTPGGSQVAVKTLDTSGSPPGAGALFGLAVAPGGQGVYFVDDATNMLNLLH